MTTFTKGDPVWAGNTRAEFVAYTGPDKASAIIKVGMDTRVVGAVSLRKAE